MLSLGGPCVPKSFQYHNLLPAVRLGAQQKAKPPKNMKITETTAAARHATTSFCAVNGPGCLEGH